MANAVIVVDMLRGFLEEGNPLYCGARARGIIPNVQGLLERESLRGCKIFYLCDHHTPDDAEFKMFSPHCIAGTAEAEIIPELAAYPGEVIPKTRFSGFYATALEEKLKALKSDIQAELEGVRPALLSSAAIEALDELRRFRHLFRHLHQSELSPAGVALAFGQARRLEKLCVDEPGAFLSFLEGLESE